MSHGTGAPNCCRLWLPDAILVAGETLHTALLGSTTSNFAHLQKKYPHIHFHVRGTASLALPPFQRLHVEAQCNDPNLLGNVETDLVDLVETACDVAADSIGLSDDQVQDVFEMIRVERCIIDAGLPPQTWAPQAYGLPQERLCPGAMAKRLPQKRQLPVVQPTAPFCPPALPQASLSAPISQAHVAGMSAPPANGSQARAVAPPSDVSAPKQKRARGSRGPWGQAIAKDTAAAWMNRPQDRGDLDEPSTPEMDLDEEDFAVQLGLAFAAVEPPRADQAEAETPAAPSSEVATAASKKPRAAKSAPTKPPPGTPLAAPADAAAPQEVPKAAGDATPAAVPVAPQQAPPAATSSQEEASQGKAPAASVRQKLPPVPVFEAPLKTAGDEVDEGSSSGSSSGSEDEDEGEEEEDMEADEEVEAEGETKEGAEGSIIPAEGRRCRLFKLGEFCCNVSAGLVSGCKEHQELLERFDIDQRIKVDRCRLHLEQAGDQVTVWEFTVAGNKNRAPYKALCDYFVGKDRVGLVDTPSYYMYVVPPGDKFQLGPLKSKSLVGIQVPKDRADS